MDVREKLVDVHGKLMGLLQRAPYIRCEDVHRQYAVNWLMNNGVTVQELDGCKYCRIASYTENPFTVITQMGREVKTQFNFCPNCGRRLIQQTKGE